VRVDASPGLAPSPRRYACMRARCRPPARARGTQQTLLTQASSAAQVTGAARHCRARRHRARAGAATGRAQHCGGTRQGRCVAAPVRTSEPGRLAACMRAMSCCPRCSIASACAQGPAPSAAAGPPAAPPPPRSPGPAPADPPAAGSAPGGRAPPLSPAAAAAPAPPPPAAPRRSCGDAAAAASSPPPWSGAPPPPAPPPSAPSGSPRGCPSAAAGCAPRAAAPPSSPRSCASSAAPERSGALASAGPAPLASGAARARAGAGAAPAGPPAPASGGGAPAPPRASNDASHYSPPAHTKSRVSYTSWLTGVPAGRACLSDAARAALAHVPVSQRRCRPDAARLLPHGSPALLLSARTEAISSRAPPLRGGRAWLPLRACAAARRRTGRGCGQGAASGAPCATAASYAASAAAGSLARTASTTARRSWYAGVSRFFCRLVCRPARPSGACAPLPAAGAPASRACAAPSRHRADLALAAGSTPGAVARCEKESRAHARQCQQHTFRGWCQPCEPDSASHDALLATSALESGTSCGGRRAPPCMSVQDRLSADALVISGAAACRLARGRHAQCAAAGAGSARARARRSPRAKPQRALRDAHSLSCQQCFSRVTKTKRAQELLLHQPRRT